MKVEIEFHELDRRITKFDYEMNAEEIAALLNAKTINFPVPSRFSNVKGEVIESTFEIPRESLSVKIKEVLKK